MSDSDVLAPFEEMIEREYRRLGPRLGWLGWRFLYTPACTLAPETRLAFVGLNPGDDKPHDPILCVEKGNAYRIEVEDWWGPKQQAGLQTQVRLLYEKLAERTEGATWKELMDHQTLALNFCPFRSQRWDRLDRQTQKELIAFSEGMWARVLKIVEPSVIVCLGNDPMKHLDSVLRARATTWTGLIKRPVAWKDATWAVRTYTTTSREVTLVRIPHLSTFKIFRHPESESATTEIVDTISAALRNAKSTT